MGHLQIVFSLLSLNVTKKVTLSGILLLPNVIPRSFIYYVRDKILGLGMLKAFCYQATPSALFALKPERKQICYSRKCNV